MKHILKFAIPEVFSVEESGSGVRRFYQNDGVTGGLFRAFICPTSRHRSINLYQLRVV